MRSYAVCGRGWCVVTCVAVYGRVRCVYGRVWSCMVCGRVRSCDVRSCVVLYGVRSCVVLCGVWSCVVL